jgi:hypothetical protein
MKSVKHYINEAIAINSINKISIPLTFVKEIINLKYNNTFQEDFVSNVYYKLAIKAGKLDRQFLIDLDRVIKRLNSNPSRVEINKAIDFYFGYLNKMVPIDESILIDIKSILAKKYNAAFIRLAEVLLDNLDILPRNNTSKSNDKKLLKMMITNFKKLIRTISDTEIEVTEIDEPKINQEKVEIKQEVETISNKHFDSFNQEVGNIRSDLNSLDPEEELYRLTTKYSQEKITNIIQYIYSHWAVDLINMEDFNKDQVKLLILKYIEQLFDELLNSPNSRSIFEEERLYDINIYLFTELEEENIDEGHIFEFELTVTRYELNDNDVIEDEIDALSIYRTFNFTTKTIKNTLLQLDYGLQGSDFNKKLFIKHLETYKAMGMEEIVLTANIDVGWYAWLRYGFIPVRDYSVQDICHLPKKFLRKFGNVIGSTRGIREIFIPDGLKKFMTENGCPELFDFFMTQDTIAMETLGEQISMHLDSKYKEPEDMKNFGIELESEHINTTITAGGREFKLKIPYKLVFTMFLNKNLRTFANISPEQLGNYPQWEGKLDLSDLEYTINYINNVK